jgi:hypothetical protein
MHSCPLRSFKRDQRRVSLDAEVCFDQSTDNPAPALNNRPNYRTSPIAIRRTGMILLFILQSSSLSRLPSFFVIPGSSLHCVLSFSLLFQVFYHHQSCHCLFAFLSSYSTHACSVSMTSKPMNQSPTKIRSGFGAAPLLFLFCFHSSTL